MSLKISKTEFKKDVMDNCRRLFRKELDEATPQEQYQSVSYAVKDMIVENWIATQKQLTKDDPKIVYYMSMEFLMGRALGNNLINMTAYEDVKEALDELGIDLNFVEDQEPDPALGNGGLGRLAACFLDSLASLGYAAYGCGIRSSDMIITRLIHCVSGMQSRSWTSSWIHLTRVITTKR